MKSTFLNARGGGAGHVWSASANTLKGNIHSNELAK